MAQLIAIKTGYTTSLRAFHIPPSSSSLASVWYWLRRLQWRLERLLTTALLIRCQSCNSCSKFDDRSTDGVLVSINSIPGGKGMVDCTSLIVCAMNCMKALNEFNHGHELGVGVILEMAQLYFVGQTSKKLSP